MSKHTVTFIGDPNPKATGRERDSISIYGVTFERDEPKVLDDAEPGIAHAVAKLKGNSHFNVQPDFATEEGVPAQPGTPETDADPRNPNAPAEEPTPLEEAIAQAPHPAETPEAVAKRAQRAAKKAAKQG
jgi:hypothetical protein